MHVYALDSDFKMVTVGIPYDNLQWKRRYYEAGEFIMQLSLSIYDPSWAYIGTPDRPELGMVQRVEYDDSDTVILWGFFAEKMLDWKAIYPRYTYNAVFRPMAALYMVDIAEIAGKLFEARKGDLPISFVKGERLDMMMSEDASLDVVDDSLGSKLYSYLETFQCSYRVYYDFDGKGLCFQPWTGRVRLPNNSSSFKAAPMTFSDEFGNVGSRFITLDDSDYYNYAIVPVDADEDGKERETLYVDLSDGGFRREIVIDMRSSSVSDDQTMEQWRSAVMQEAKEQLMSYVKVEDVNVQPLSDKGYMRDYDLGDYVNAKISKLGFEISTRIVEVIEVFKADGGHEISLGLGNKRISNIRRATLR